MQNQAKLKHNVPFLKKRSKKKGSDSSPLTVDLNNDTESEWFSRYKSKDESKE